MKRLFGIHAGEIKRVAAALIGRVARERDEREPTSVRSLKHFRGVLEVFNLAPLRAVLAKFRVDCHYSHDVTSFCNEP